MLGRPLGVYILQPWPVHLRTSALFTGMFEVAGCRHVGRLAGLEPRVRRRRRRECLGFSCDASVTGSSPTGRASLILTSCRLCASSIGVSVCGLCCPGCRPTQRFDRAPQDCTIYLA
ncbi:hypothetical protein FKP32DRAFT_687127 [Trametes sanguinea]|nr:hypothetical protein FKP32DRAFT_687127 [Trametes sanguinea]